MNDSKAIKRTLLALAEYFDKSLTESQLAMFAHDLSDLNAEAVERAALVYRRDPKNTRFPLPAALRAIIEPQVDESSLAIDLATRICAAISYHGYTWEFANVPGVAPAFAPYPTFHDALVAELGEVSAEVVRRFGGWKAIHDAYFDSDRTAFMAQLRDRVLATLKMAKAGTLLSNPRLPTGQRLRVASGSKGPMQIGEIAATLIYQKTGNET
jgi:hypothetical protein